MRYACSDHRGELTAYLREHYGAMGPHAWRRPPYATSGRTADTDREWAQVAAKPAHGGRRTRLLLRIGGKLLSDGVGPRLVCALMFNCNRSLCCPPLQSFEVEKAWRWLIERRNTR